MSMLEKEVKVLLSEKQYNELKKIFIWDHEFIQVNYYYESDNGITIRIREKNELKLQVKIPREIRTSLHIKDEYEMKVTEVYEKISKVLLEKMTNQEFNYDRKLIGCLKTKRSVSRAFEEIEICLDKNDYLDICDYELEVEYTGEYLSELRICKEITLQSCLPMSPIAQVKKPQHSPLCLRFLTCTLEDIFSAILQCYFFTAPN